MPRYGLIDHSNGLLVRVTCKPSGSYDGESFEFSNDEREPIFCVPSLQQIANALFEDTPSYNSSHDRPGWGDFRLKRNLLKAVEIAVQVTVTPVEMKELANLYVLDSRDIPVGTVRRYLGLSELPAGSYIYQPVDLTRSGLTREQLQALVGQEVCIGSPGHRRELVGVTEMPGEFADVWMKDEGDVMLTIARSCEPRAPYSGETFEPLVLAGLNV